MLRISQLKKNYRQPDGQTVEILDLPQFQLGIGEQAVLIGPSGCGKTTLLHLIAGIISPTSGVVELDGLKLSQFSESARDRIRADKLGYVFQTFNLLPAFSALENVVLGMSFSSKRVSRSRALELLDQVGLSHRLHHRPGSLSVGEQQRVAVARALANSPKLLLADEPTANVDPHNQQQVIDLIRSVCSERQISLLLVTHAMEVANQFNRVDRLEEINLVVRRSRVTV